MKVTEKIITIKDIHEQAEQISAHLQKAIIIEDKNFELIAYSSPSGFSFDPVQQKTILTKRCPLYVIERLKKEGVVERLKSDDRPIRLDRMEDILFYERVVISLQHEGRLYGYLWIYEAAMLDEVDLAFLTEIASSLGESLYKKQREKEMDAQTFIWKLLNHEYLNETEMLQAAKMISFPVAKQFTVIVYSVKDARYVHVLEKMRTYFVTHHISYYLGKGTEIVGIVGTDATGNVHDKTNQMIQEISADLSREEMAAIFIGVGETYEHMNHIRKSYVEALEVIETLVFLNIEQQTTYYFRKLGVYRYLKIMYKKNVGEDFRNEDLVRLLRKDTENNSELLLTLWYFLKNDCKVARTADELFIHPNTMNYRLKQIAEVIQLDFSDMQEKTELYIQLQLIHLVPDYKRFYQQIV